MPFVQGIHYSVHRHKDISSARPPLILLHGAGGSFLSWHPHLRHLGSEAVYALDLPGHGQSEGEGRKSIEEYANDIFQFMLELNLNKVILLGHSMGSAIALILALNHPEHFMGLVILGGGAKLRVTPTTIEAVSDPSRFSSAVETINRNCFGWNTSPELIELSKQNMLKTKPATLLNDFLACNQFDVADRVASIQIPTLILCGDQDVMTPPKHSRFLKEKIVNSTFHLVEGAGHMVMLENVNEVLDSLKVFLDGLPPLT